MKPTAGAFGSFEDDFCMWPSGPQREEEKEVFEDMKRWIRSAQNEVWETDEIWVTKQPEKHLPDELFEI